jgi:hypothetical protein
MHFAAFYQHPVNYGQTDLSPIEACGDRAVIVLDARQRPQTHIDIATRECAKRGYIGFTLHMGQTFTRASMVRSLELI